MQLFLVSVWIIAIALVVVSDIGESSFSGKDAEEEEEEGNCRRSLHAREIMDDISAKEACGYAILRGG